MKNNMTSQLKMKQRSLNPQKIATLMEIVIATNELNFVKNHCKALVMINLILEAVEMFYKLLENKVKVKMRMNLTMIS